MRLMVATRVVIFAVLSVLWASASDAADATDDLFSKAPVHRISIELDDVAFAALKDMTQQGESTGVRPRTGPRG